MSDRRFEQPQEESSRRRSTWRPSPSDRSCLGRIQRVLDGDQDVELHSSADGAFRLSITTFPSVEWVRSHVGRWVFVDPAIGVRVVSGPDELVRILRDPQSNDTLLYCLLCVDKEIWRVTEQEVRNNNELTMLRKCRAILGDHFIVLHPGVFDALR